MHKVKATCQLQPFWALLNFRTNCLAIEIFEAEQNTNYILRREKHQNPAFLKEKWALKTNAQQREEDKNEVTKNNGIISILHS